MAARRVRRVAVLLALGLALAAQAPPAKPAPKPNAIHVNWLYGAYVPRDVPLLPLTAPQRGKLYLYQTYLTWGIYLKTGVFALGDQASNSPEPWGRSWSGYGKRIASRFGQFAVQNSFSAAGNLMLGYEPRYDRCHCDGAGPRLRHAVTRNFVTYDSSERRIRPQIALYAGALGAGMVSATWLPGHAPAWRRGYQAMVTQAVFGSFTNTIGEFAPEITRVLRRVLP